MASVDDEIEQLTSGKQAVKGNWKWMVFGLSIVAAAVAVGIYYWLYLRNVEYTDNALISADVTLVSSKVSGQVVKLLVTDNQVVQKGDLLFEIDPADFRVRLDQTLAELNAAEVEAARAQTESSRNKQLFQRRQISRQAFDNAAAAAAVAQAKVQVVGQQVAAAKLNLSYTKIVALQSGRITRRSVNLANFVEAGRTLMAIVPEQIYVIANFKETQVGRIKSGQKVLIKVDTFPDYVFRGHVDSIQSGTGGAFSLLPADNASGNYVKVVQRVPVKIVFDEPTTGYLLVPGMSVVPTVVIR